MNIIALHPYDHNHLSKVMSDAVGYKDVTIRGFYDSFDDIFYLLEGCHRIECAKRLSMPLVLIDCNISSKINVKIPGLLNIFEEPVFDESGFAKVEDIIVNCNWIGNVYSSQDFISIAIKPH